MSGRAAELVSSDSFSRLVLALCLLAAGVTACAREGEEWGAPPALQQRVVGGREAELAGSVALVDVGGTLRCSAGLIAPRLVLTAGHCFVDGAAPPMVSFRSDAKEPFALATRFELHPRFEVTGSFGSKYAHDLALLFLDTDSSVQTLSLGWEPPELGATVNTVAYGRTGPDAQDQGVRRSGSSVVTALEEDEFAVAPGPAQPCLFDSGGPVLSESGELIGIVSTGDRDCGSSAHAMRIDAEREWIAQGVAKAQSESESDERASPRAPSGCSTAASGLAFGAGWPAIGAVLACQFLAHRRRAGRQALRTPR